MNGGGLRRLIRLDGEVGVRARIARSPALAGLRPIAPRVAGPSAGADQEEEF